MTITRAEIEAAPSPTAEEPSSATALAALISGAYKPRVGVLPFGANVELTRPATRVHP